MYEERSKIIGIIIAVIGVIFLIRLLYIQVIDQQYKAFAENNALRKEIVTPARGMIYDRNGKELIKNQLIYDVMAVPGKVKNLDTIALCNLLEVDINDFKESFHKAKKYSHYRASAIIRQISQEQYGKLQERLFSFRGFFVQSRLARSYPDSLAGHLLGYTGEASPEEIEKSEKYYQMGDYLGKSGLEKSYEDSLKGKKGTKFILVDVLNREQGRYREGEFDIPAVPGKDLITGIDFKLQQYAEKLMKGKKGSIVAIEPSTGEILAMVSAPAYDPNLLLGRKRTANIAKLVMDKDKPMFNRAISAKYPPGSTMKLLEALVGMQEKVIMPSTTFSCGGGYRISARHSVGCHSTGTFDVHNSIRLSCNTYYCNLFKVLVDNSRYGGPAAGLDNWQKWLNEFGAGKKLGIDIPNESKGFVPSSKFYNKAYGERRWRASTIISLGIGQAEVGFTPLQLANVAAIIANKGYYIQPHFVKAFSKMGKREPIAWEKRKVNIDQQYFDIMQDAMQAVVDNGTAGLARVKGISICGKTGTSQNPHGQDHSIFICFAPKENPKIALAIFIENAGFGGTWAAPMAGLMIERYINDSLGTPMARWHEKRILEFDYNNLPVESH